MVVETYQIRPAATLHLARVGTCGGERWGVVAVVAAALDGLSRLARDVHVAQVDPCVGDKYAARSPVIGIEREVSSRAREWAPLHHPVLLVGEHTEHLIGFEASVGAVALPGVTRGVVDQAAAWNRDAQRGAQVVARVLAEAAVHEGGAVVVGGFIVRAAGGSACRCAGGASQSPSAGRADASITRANSCGEGASRARRTDTVESVGAGRAGLAAAAVHSTHGRARLARGAGLRAVAGSSGRRAERASRAGCTGRRRVAVVVGEARRAVAAAARCSGGSVEVVRHECRDDVPHFLVRQLLAVQLEMMDGAAELKVRPVCAAHRLS